MEKKLKKYQKLLKKSEDYEGPAMSLYKLF